MSKYIFILLLFPAVSFADFSCDETFPAGDWKITYCQNEDLDEKITLIKEKLLSDLEFKRNWRIEFDDESKYVDEYKNMLDELDSNHKAYSENFCQLYLFTGGLWAGSGEASSQRICSGWMLTERLARYESLLEQWPYVTQPSFDCEKAQLDAEKLVCKSESLSKYDRSLSGFYLEAINVSKDKEFLVESQRKWLGDVRNLCKDESCLQDAYRDRVIAIRSALEE